MKKRVRLGDLARVTHGYAFDGAGFTSEVTGNILITPGNFSIGGGFKLDKPKYFRGEVPERFVLKPGDLVVTMTDLSKSMDTLGCVAIIPELTEGARALHNQRVGKFELISDEVDRGYLAYRLRGHDYLAEVRASSSGSTVHHTSPGRIEQFEFDLPPLTEQRAIAATLGALDDKIESNQRIQSLSLSLARAIFDKSLNSAATSRLSDIATVVLGGTPSKSEAAFWGGQEISWINSGAANQEVILTPTEYITSLGLQNSAAKLMPKGATVLAITGATLGQVAILGIETAGNQSLIGIWGSSPESNAWIHFAIQTRINELLTHATGAAQQHVNKQNVEQLAVPVLSPGELEKWGRGVVPLVERAVSAPAESLRLAALRDALLPELLSGRVRVGEAAK